MIVVDQFEELFTLCPPQAEEQRQAFIDNLLYAATISGGRTIVLITMRADFYGKCSRYQSLAHALSEGQELVPPLGDDELRAAIVRPAQLCRLELEPGLVDLLLQGMRAQPAGALPLLQQALLMLWQKRQGRRLTVQAYREIGEIEGAIEAHANQLYTQRMQNDDQRAICRRVLLMLTNPGEGTEDTRRRVARSQLGENPAVESVLDVLVKGRLITISDSDPAQVEVTHEALIRGWHELREWINEDRESLRTLQQLIDAAEEWETNGRDAAYLYQGSRLAQAEEWRTAHAAELVDLPVATAFIDAAVKGRHSDILVQAQFLTLLNDLQRQKELKNIRRLRLALAVSLAFGVAAALFGFGLYASVVLLKTSDCDLLTRESELAETTSKLQTREKYLEKTNHESISRRMALSTPIVMSIINRV